MRKLAVFNNVSLDGYIADSKGDMSWAHRQDAEWAAFTAENSKGDSAMLFGRVTYDMMAGFWPTPAAAQSLPDLSRRMNEAQKYVVSRTLTRADWNNTKLIKDDLSGTVRKLKAEPGPDLVIFGSGTVISQLTEDRLVDQYQIIVVPVVLGGGKPMFAGVGNNPQLRHIKSRSFTNGNVALWYELVP